MAQHGFAPAVLATPERNFPRDFQQNAYTWCVISVDAPEWYFCPVYKTILGKQEDFDKICSETPIALAPGLFDVPKADTPPPIDFLRSLPEVDTAGFWGIYALVMEKLGFPVKLCVGSGTNARDRVLGRMRDYDRQQLLPRFVKLAPEAGYTITHRGLLC
ncbi:hypothetical protein B0H67DRAFT_548886 [Lasiosphaeris hirsuta]|uniref:Uncharacterized protein n=1 Tax=Lasiosphaeris hirsuta TaxID=260670 RepID=A0AA40E8R5_9PEZI|nr:hypothetical protein B0H67DRAFT_548886 [Lasiosphaeris hirsuta]